MDEQKNVKFNLSSFFIVLFLIIIFLLCYFIYNLYEKNEQYSDEIAQLKTNNNSSLDDKIKKMNEDTTDNQNETNKQNINNFDVYKNNYSTDFKNIISDNNKISIYLGSEDRKDELPGITEVYLDANNDVYVNIDSNSNLYSKYGDTYKIESNVANIYVCHVGNNSLSDVIFIKQDGTVSILSGTDTASGNIQCNQNNTVKDIISVIPYTQVDEMGLEADSYAFIDVNGNIINQ